jgi:hypothetical protein
VPSGLNNCLLRIFLKPLFKAGLVEDDKLIVLSYPRMNSCDREDHPLPGNFLYITKWQNQISVFTVDRKLSCLVGEGTAVKIKHSAEYTVVTKTANK